MKKMDGIMTGNLSSLREKKEQTVMLDPLAAQLVDQVFVKMALICRGFDSFYSDRNRLNAEKTQWIIAFTKLGIRSKAQIEHALTRIELYRHPNPPQLGEFLDWRLSSPQDMGLPDFEQAYKLSILINQQFSTYKPQCQKTYTVIKHAIDQIGTKDYREMSIDKARKIFEHSYSVACRQFMNGALKEIPKAIPENTQEHVHDKKRNSDARQKAMDAIKLMGINIKRLDAI